MKKINLVLLTLFGCSHALFAQFAPQVGFAGTTAIHKDSSVIKAWATSCVLQRGWQNIADTSLGYAQVGDETYVPGAAGNGVASLGDGGMATVSFANPVKNGPGYDFAVFENGFIYQNQMAYLEFAFVEVSSDGEHFFRFKPVSKTDTASQVNGTSPDVLSTTIDASKVHNLAGKYIANYGTPFDLEELKDEPGLDVDHITHIRLIDVVGSIDPAYGTRDSSGGIINDPWPTPFASSGFDLDAVGVINENAVTSVKEILRSKLRLTMFPNPATPDDEVVIRFNTAPLHATITLYDQAGKKISEHALASGDDKLVLSSLARGFYLVTISTGSVSQTHKLVIR